VRPNEPERAGRATEESFGSTLYTDYSIDPDQSAALLVKGDEHLLMTPNQVREWLSQYTIANSSMALGSPTSQQKLLGARAVVGLGRAAQMMRWDLNAQRPQICRSESSGSHESLSK
jgi:hypothetical protein